MNGDYRLVLNSENRGFCVGSNQGLQTATGENLVLLNNDVIVTPGWLERLLNCADSDSRIGMVGPMSNYVSGCQGVAEVGYDTSTLVGLEDFADHWTRQHVGEVIEYWRQIGFCMLIRRAVIDKIGGLDPIYGLGTFDDDDFCLRASIAGFTAVSAKDCFVHHFGSRTFWDWN